MDGEAKSTLPVAKGLLKTKDLYDYLLETSVLPHEPEPLKELREITSDSHPRLLPSTLTLSYAIGLPIIEKAGVMHKIDFIESEALPVLDKLLEDPHNKETFDFAFVDADKANYANYHEKLLDLLKPNAIIIYDNTLWGGTIVMPEDSVPKNLRATRSCTIKFNKYLSADSRVQICQIPLGDGMTICRRL